MPASHTRAPQFSCWMQLLTPAFHQHTLGGSSDGSSRWIPAILTGDLDCVSDSCFWPQISPEMHLRNEPALGTPAVSLPLKKHFFFNQQRTYLLVLQNYCIYLYLLERQGNSRKGRSRPRDHFHSLVHYSTVHDSQSPMWCQ